MDEREKDTVRPQTANQRILHDLQPVRAVLKSAQLRYEWRSGDLL